MNQATRSDEQAHLRVIGEAETLQDTQTVTPDGKPLFQLIDGVRERRAVTHMDERGTICEMYDPAWSFDEAPLVYIYQATLLPGYAKGWVLHYEQDDRLFFATGRIRVVLFDGRSPVKDLAEASSNALVLQKKHPTQCLDTIATGLLAKRFTGARFAQRSGTASGLWSPRVGRSSGLCR